MKTSYPLSLALLLSVAAVLLLSGAWSTSAAAQDRNLTQYVDPLIGTAGSGWFAGDTEPSARVPYGMIHWGPDNSNIPGGYQYGSNTIRGFSLTHFSGRGCSYLLDAPIMPFAGAVQKSPATDPNLYRSTFTHAGETAAPGYYGVRLGSNVQTELTATLRSGLGKFTFPALPAASLLLFGGSANGARGGTNVQVVGSNEISAVIESQVGCGGETYKLYVSALFDRPFAEFGAWNGGTLSKGGRSASGGQCGAYATFDTTQNPVVHVKVGLSYVSVANARLNRDTECPGWDFRAVRQAANDGWNRVLNLIQVDGGSRDDLTVFYTALYHCYLHPNVFSDVNGEYIGFDKQIHIADGYTHYTHIPCWDEYRSHVALRALLSPDSTGDVLQSLVNDALQGGGGMPRWVQANRNSGGMVGDHGSTMIANGFAFGAVNFDVSSALNAMIYGAYDPSARSDGHVTREGLANYLTLGYVPGAAAVTEEYTTGDFAISQFAAALGDADSSAYFLQRAQYWYTLFNPNSGLPEGGYLMPRNADGSFPGNFRPNSQAGYVEGSGAQYLWMVPYNLRDLFDLLGGNDAVVQRLDAHFTRLNDGPDSVYAFMGNEPEEGAPWTYLFAGAPWRTQDVVRRIQRELFRTTPDGLPGNDDAGSLSSWYVFSALGLYPAIPGVGGLAVGSPKFSRAVVRLGSGQLLQITGQGAADSAPYVQSLRLNGVPTTSLWIPVETLLAGATLDFTLGASPNYSWGSDPADAPPSFPDNTIQRLPLRINCGGGAVAAFISDSFFSGGHADPITETIDTSGVTDPAPQAVYQSKRTGSAGAGFRYTIPRLAPGGSYRVRLHFAESLNIGRGGRRFHVAINGARVLTDFDILAEAGGRNRALIREFAVVGDESGRITIDYVPGAAGNPLANGLELLSN